MATNGLRVSVAALVGLSGISCGHSSEVIKPPEEPSICVADEKRLSPESIDRGLRRNIAQIRSEESFGSGFFLDTDDANDVLIVTNYHVIAEGNEFSVRSIRPDGTAVVVSGVEVVKTNPKEDLALLKAPRMTSYGTGLRLAATVRNGESVTTLGYPAIAEAANEPTLGNGFVTAAQHTIDDRKFVLTDMPLLPGNSGGPAVDSCGAVVGVTSAFLTDARNVGLLVPVAQVDALYRAYMAPKQSEDAQIRRRIKSFGRLLERGDEAAASSYFSRSFYSSSVFPRLKAAALKYAKDKRLMSAALEYIAEHGVDPRNLTEEQLRFIMERLGVDMQPLEIFTHRLLQVSEQRHWDMYVTLQKFFTPFLALQFGKVQKFDVEEITAQGATHPVYAALRDPNGRFRRVQFDMVYEWGDWQIANFQAIGDADDSATAQPAPPPMRSEVERSTDMIPASNSRR